MILLGVDNDKYEGAEDGVAADKVDSEEVTEELCEAVQESAAQPPEQEAGAANWIKIFLGNFINNQWRFLWRLHE